MFVSVVLIGMNGLPIEAIRRSFESGPLNTPPMGEDGLVGGVEVEVEVEDGVPPGDPGLD